MLGDVPARVQCGPKMDSWSPGYHTTQTNQGVVQLEKPQKVVKELEEDRIKSRDERGHITPIPKGTCIRKI